MSHRSAHALTVQPLRVRTRAARRRVARIEQRERLWLRDGVQRWPYQFRLVGGRSTPPPPPPPPAPAPGGPILPAPNGLTVMVVFATGLTRIRQYVLGGILMLAVPEKSLPSWKKGIPLPNQRQLKVTLLDEIKSYVLPRFQNEPSETFVQLFLGQKTCLVVLTILFLLCRCGIS